MSKQHDLWLWACLGIFGLLAAKACHKQLHAVRAAAEVPLEVRIADEGNDKARHDPSLKSLERLALGPNPQVREAAIRLIEDIALRNQPYSLLLKQVSGSDKRRRDEALLCLRYITNKPMKIPKPYHHTYRAILKCLGRLHCEACEFETALRAMGFGNRSPHYSNALTILVRLISYDYTDAPWAGLLNWLENYPYGGYYEVEDRKKIIKRLLTNDYIHEPMHTVLVLGLGIPCIENGLKRCNLIEDNMVSASLLEGRGVPWYNAMAIHPRTDRGSIAASLSMHREDVDEGSPDDWLLRRRRREAIVVAEAGRPIGPDDIIYHDPSLDWA